MTQPNPPTFEALVDMIRRICDAPTFTDNDQRIRIIRKTIDVYRQPVDPSPAAAAAEVPAELAPRVEFVDAGTPAEFARALAASFDDDGYVDADVLAENLTEQRRPMTGAEALDAAAAQGPEAFAQTLNSVFDAFARAARDEDDREEQDR